ncbi:uncharacterized protein LOC113291206 [Papaver somniferum]|uniref:uncharacterized protein LOC113291206 n=1 Tax=Papaver somniferum TaxID=3469 RepID=UPI000E6F7D41|nr:uncharacterized protein LOC113291206 [Papaver somniferum]
MATPIDESPLIPELELAPPTISDSRKRFSYYPQISPPSINIEKFYVPGLNTASNDTEIIKAATISFELCFSYFTGAGKRFERRIYYDDIQMAFYYYGTNSNVLIGNISIPAFRQNPYSSFRLYRSLRIETFGVPWDEVRREVSNGGTARFHVGLDTKFEYSTGWWKPDLNLGANVTVNDHGMKTAKYLPLKAI